MRPLANKHANIKASAYQGKTRYVLLHNNQLLADVYDAWSAQLSKEQAFKTVETYAYAVANFLDYVEELSIELGGLVGEDFRRCLDGYESYLVYGVNASDEKISKVAQSLNSNTVSYATVETLFAGVNSFIDFSNDIVKQLNDLKVCGYIQSQNLSDEPNIITVAKRKRSVNVILAMKKNSWLAGCIRGATRKIVRSKALIRTKRPKASNVVRTDDFGGSEYIFPIDLCKKFIEEAPCLRDKVLYSLLAATGIRIHEALTMLIDDVFIQNGKVFVKVIDPKFRIKEFNQYYSEEKISEISHKSRAIEATYLIEPFKSMLINYLPAYLAEERNKDLLRITKHLTLSSHRFLFRTFLKGKPMVFSYRSLLGRMHKHSIASVGKRYAFHSLRHMYGYYMANFCPRPTSNGVVYGFGLDIVQKLMGHCSSKSTERYAKQDHDLLEAMLSASNFCRNNGTDYSVIDAKISYLESKVRDLKLAKEAQAYA